VVEPGRSPQQQLTRRQFDGLRANPAFQELLAQAQAGRTRALEAFRQAGGIRLLA